DFQMRIFDRWGAVVYESTDPAEGWDGRRKGSKLGSGVYVWWATYTVIENDKPREVSETGDISLIK
ncbi:MAG: gliding motility-associated C-terminal domain-containing protein, partial [Saprospiraceae bacterium]|nr:gliding motility-associated C-terminal domain-containing protein [Saprospiraceae bacterium]